MPGRTRLAVDAGRDDNVAISITTHPGGAVRGMAEVVDVLGLRPGWPRFAFTASGHTG